jgi:signal transduction histidine kinase
MSRLPYLRWWRSCYCESSQEALANVRKHAHAQNAWIRFRTMDTSKLEMVVADDSQWFEVGADFRDCC